MVCPFKLSWYCCELSWNYAEQLLLTFIWKVSGSSLSIDTDCREAFFAVFWVLPVKRRDIALNYPWPLPYTFLSSLLFIINGRYSAVGIVTRLRAGRSRVQILAVDKECMSLPGMSIPALGPTQPPLQWVTGFFPGVEQPGLFVDNSVPFSAEVKNDWSCTSTPPICLCGVDKDNFTFFNINQSFDNM